MREPSSGFGDDLSVGPTARPLGPSGGANVLPEIRRRFRHLARQWLTSQRVIAAQGLSETTAMSAKEIAQRVGRGTAANLRHHFHRRVRTTPMAYRRAFSCGRRANQSAPGTARRTPPPGAVRSGEQEALIATR